MANSSAVTVILLSAYYGMDDLKPVYFSVFLILYITIIMESLALMGVICVKKTLHEPMYFLVGNLAANGLYGSTALLPALLSNIFSHSHELSLPCCQAQIYTIHTYAIVEFTILAAMSYDRYVAICYPLQYQAVMPLSRVYRLIIFTWLYPLVAFLIVFILTLNLQFCEKTLDKLYCVNYSLVKLSCSDTSMVNIVGLLSVVVYACPQLIMVLYSYIQILRICALSSKESRLKALRTCTPHLLAVINYSIGCFFEIAQSRFNLSHLPYKTKVFLSLYFLIFPPILNPAIYGLSIQAIRVPLLNLFQHKNKVAPAQQPGVKWA
ncbi:olfactory receptor 51G1-like [Lampris incognitus]|uniref:olfactory receptor 51G1-like n=1 Tax=Lampris incognitus TaxID=2546036 RepID=UPI0024B4C318|nr:olfactory receptor 51G1-like [Lampris incognitus]